MESLVAGAAAGLVVDLTLYPIDTIKTRLQSRDGLYRAGGFRGVYRGLSAVAVGSVPGGAAFFVGYDFTKMAILGDNGSGHSTGGGGGSGSSSTDGNTTSALKRNIAQAAAAMAGETSACLIRVPTEMVKQQLQVGHHHSVHRALVHITQNIPADAAADVTSKHIHWRGFRYLFMGMPIMLLRELPFAVIQMTCYEALKVSLHTDESPKYLPLCGALSGGTAAFFTTPLDVLKTRIMLGQVGTATAAPLRGAEAVRAALNDLLREAPRATDRWGPAQRFFRGVVPRVMWISLGGSVFFTTYETVRRGYRWATVS
ncbi:mitochondrial carrier protein [Trypanosoma grayi]|uniref:mitochondrial carrier protein n=1 Tax=Trypanosoma grayi TaxID=71804 RepID=UPI0004F43F50|nr:mitochondrial carrier protein [Trypanosoma grayi]KEG08195.1 mitochondrial carrier protein [Trypanosoma grayi]